MRLGTKIEDVVAIFEEARGDAPIIGGVHNQVHRRENDVGCVKAKATCLGTVQCVTVRRAEGRDTTRGVRRVQTIVD